MHFLGGIPNTFVGKFPTIWIAAEGYSELRRGRHKLHDSSDANWQVAQEQGYHGAQKARTTFGVATNGFEPKI